MNELHELIYTWYRDWFRTDALYGRWAQGRKMSYASLFTLYYLHTQGACHPSDISSYLSLSKQTVSSILNRFLSSGLIERETDLADARSRTIRLTVKGKAYAQRTFDDLYRVESRAFGHLTGEEARTMVALQHKLTESITLEMEEGSHEVQK